MTTTQVLTAKEAEALVTRIGPSLGCGDFTYGARFPEGRTDVCVVRRMAENGTDYGYDTIYLVWKDAAGALQHSKVATTKGIRSGDYLYVDSVEAKKDAITIAYNNGGGSYSGKGWKDKKTITIT